MKKITTHVAARRLDVTVREIQLLVARGRLTEHRFGRILQIDEDELDRLQPLGNGRPPKWRNRASKKGPGNRG